MIEQLSRVYPSVGESEQRMLDDVSGFLDQFDLDPQVRHSLTLCVSEAFTNALKHGNQWNALKVVTVNLRVNDEEVCADITDQGSNALTAISCRPHPGPLAESGRGVDLIYRYCPGVEMSEVSGGGLRVRLVLPRRKRANVID
jgi:anti-sigma regulatory factor (Ser/Thr protein kinase)